MNKKHYLTGSILLLATIIIFQVACKKESSSGKTATQYLTSSPWHYIRYDEDWYIDGSINYSDTANTCRSGATYTFMTNNIVTYTPTTVACDSTDVADKSTWVLENNGTVFSWWGNIYNIQMLNDTVMNIYFDAVFPDNGIKYRAHLIYKH